MATARAQASALAWLDDLAEWIAGWHRTERPRIERPVGLIFAAVYIGLNIIADVAGILANPRLRHPK